MRIVPLAALLVVPLLVGCDLLWNVSNRSHANQSMTDLLGEQGVELTDVRCNMVESTRSFECALSLSDADLEQITTGLKLSDQQPTTVLQDEGCAGLANSKTVERFYTVEARPPEISGFEYLYLHYDAETGAACLQSSYAYG